MASETVSSDHASAPEVVEKKECEEVKTIEEVVTPPKETEEKTKEVNPEVAEKTIEAPSTEEVTKTDEEKPKITEPEEKIEEKPKAEDASETTVTPVESKEKPKAEDSTPPPAQTEEKPIAEDLTAPPSEPEEKVEVKPETEDSTLPPSEPEKKVEVKPETEDSTSPPEPEEKVEDKIEISSDVAEKVAEGVESKSEEKLEIETESSVDAVIKEEEEVKEALPKKETETAAERDAQTSEVEHTKEVTPEVVIAEESSTVPPTVTEETEKDLADTVAKVEVEAAEDKGSCDDKAEGVEFSKEKAKDVIEKPEEVKTEVESENKAEEKKGAGTEELVPVTKKEVETLEEKTEKADETIKTATEEVAEAITLAEKADEGVGTTRDIGVLTENGSVKDEKVSDVEDKVEDEAAADTTKGSPSLGELLKPQENVEEKTVEETAPLDDVIKSDLPTKDVDTIKETSKNTPVEDVPVTKSKQSNNILTKVKQSLVKAKKAIIGKSPSSKPSSETKAEIKA